MREQLLFYAIKYNGDYHFIKRAIQNKEPWTQIKSKNKYITILDEGYPVCFMHLRFPPWVLFYEGNIALLQHTYIGVVGSRNINEYGKFCCEQLNENLNAKYGVVSGLAKGVDAYALYLALSTNRNTIAIIGCGIDVVYPKENVALYKKIECSGLLLSEYPSKCKPLAKHFPWRNRLIAALSDQIVVVQAKQRSGTMITVNEALELGKEIHCFPHSILDEEGVGCNLLIQQGCHMFATKMDITEL